MKSTEKSNRKMLKKELDNILFSKFLDNRTYKKILKQAIKNNMNNISVDVYSYYEPKLGKFLKKYNAEDFKFNPYDLFRKIIMYEIKFNLRNLEL